MKYKIQLNQLFLILSVGLTLISLAAGFAVYEILFSTFMAILISFIFELLRLSCLYSISKFDGFYRGLSLALYVMVAFVCFSAGVLSFNSKIIEKTELKHIEIAKSQSNDIYLIKNKFSKKIDEQIQVVEKHKIQIEATLAKIPDSKLWSQRLAEDVTRIEDLKKKRDDFFESIKDKPTSQWISDQKAVLGIESIQDVYAIESSPISRAANEFYGIDEVKLQKYAGVLLTFAIECGIILLAILGMNIKSDDEVIIEPEKPKKKKMKKTSTNDAVPVFFEETPTVKPKRKRERSKLSESLGE